MPTPHTTLLSLFSGFSEGLVVMEKHGKPVEEMECACCYDDITAENYIEYRTGEGKEWVPSLFCEMCVARLIERQWPLYQESLATATCKVQQKRMLGEGPPTHVYDKKALACPEGEKVDSLWFMRDGEVHSAVLKGAPQGDARRAWWDEKLAFQFEEDDEEEQQEEKRAKTSATTPETLSASLSATSTAESVSGSSREGSLQDAAVPEESREMANDAPLTHPISGVGAA